MTDSASRDAHAETNAHHASVCKACALSSAAGTAGSCQGAERLVQLERSVKRLHRLVWGLVIALLIVVAFFLGQRTQSRRDSMQPGSMGPRGMMGPMQRGDIVIANGRKGMQGPMQGSMQGPMQGPMRGMNGMKSIRNEDGTFEVRVERYENDSDNGPNDDQPEDDFNQGNSKVYIMKDGGPNQCAEQPLVPPSVVK